ncbi:zinc knuckle domain protein [Penicillium cinerascens]|uniref:Zinc knuckle domain protein n=1 Tax=Penicillium cinerascens TaxID=70096 RepID=A0A9W9N8M6_9EURO|nr:zinc knuckle domain protein [Penicillium cinerascens]KAJ5215295.1 zinc knuckle domain protein [Penicillium cinerascens]
MYDIVEGARLVLDHIENNGTTDGYVTEYIRAVRQYALNAMPNGATAREWRRDWQRGLAKAASPSTRSNGTSSAEVPDIEFREDRQVIVKVGSNREQIRGLSPRELVERAERQKVTTARQKKSAALAEGAAFIAARKLPSGDVTMVANSAAGEELLRKHTGWLKAFGPASVVQEPSWGVVAYHVPVKSMKLTPETMTDVAAELLRQRSESAKIHPVVANRAIISGVVWGKQIRNASRVCREGRMKLCRKCQKPGHIQSHCSNVYRCGHCAGEHPTWECPSTRGQAITIKCANCGQGRRPASRECPVKITALDEAKQALADCPAYHRIPLHFRNTVSSDTTSSPFRPSATERDDLDAPIHAPEGEQEADPSHLSPQVTTEPETEPTREETSLEEHIKLAKPRRGPGRPKGSKTKPKDHVLPPVQSASQRSTRSQTATQRTESEHTMSKKCRVGEPEDIMDEQPDDSDWLRPPVPIPCKSSPPVILTDAPTIEDPDDDIWYEVSERSDDDQSQQ